MYAFLTSFTHRPESSSRVRNPARRAPMAFPASSTSWDEMVMPSWRCSRPSSVWIFGGTMMPCFRPLQRAAMTPVPVIPTALPCMGPSSMTFPVMGSMRSPSTAAMVSSRT